jgi:CheY-like chemotaxis protein
MPIIAMTADAFEESVREARAGMDGYVTKPIEPQKLFEALRVHKRHDS